MANPLTATQLAFVKAALWGLLSVAALGGIYYAGHRAGHNAVAPKVVEAKSEALTEKTEGDNLKVGQQVNATRTARETTAVTQSRKTQDAISEKAAADDLDGAISAWSDGIDRLRDESRPGQPVPQGH